MLDSVESILKTYAREHGLTPMAVGHFPVSPADIPVRTRFLKPMIEARGWADRIDLYDAHYSAPHIIAQVQFHSETVGSYNAGTVASIYLTSNLNLCWRRFAVCKEMYHCMLTNPGARVTDVAGLRSLLSLLARNTTALTGPSLALNSEELAVLLALETLLPLEFRLHHLADYRSGRLDARDISQMYRVPVSYTLVAFDEDYMNLIRKIRSELLFPV